MTITREHVHESNLIEGFDDEIMDACALAAYARLCTLRRITPEDVLELHRVVVASQVHPVGSRVPDWEWRGNWRQCGISIDGRPGARWQDIPERITDWCLSVNDGVDRSLFSSEPPTPREAHIEYERIHPFLDGNGRTGRLLMWWHEHRLGLDPILIREADKYDYYYWFRR